MHIYISYAHPMQQHVDTYKLLSVLHGLMDKNKKKLFLTQNAYLNVSNATQLQQQPKPTPLNTLTIIT